MYRRNPWRRSLGGMSGGVFLIGMAIAFITGAWLPVLFVTLAVTSLLGSASSGNPNGLYGGLFSFIWLAGLALCFVVGFWPWILVIVGLSAILGAMRNAIMATILGAGFGTMYNANRGQAEYSQPAQNIPYAPSEPEQPYQSYQEGYQPVPQPMGTYQEGQQQYSYSPQSQQSQQSQPPQDEQPQAQYPEEMPPQQ